MSSVDLSTSTQPASLFVPDMKQTRTEYEDWTPIEPHVKEAFEKGLRRLQQLKPYETALVTTSLYYIWMKFIPCSPPGNRVVRGEVRHGYHRLFPQLLFPHFSLTMFSINREK